MDCILPSDVECRLIFKLVSKLLRTEAWFVPEPTEDDPLARRQLTEQADIERSQWHAIVQGLENLLPAEASLNPKRELLKL